MVGRWRACAAWPSRRAGAAGPGDLVGPLVGVGVEPGVGDGGEPRLAAVGRVHPSEVGARRRDRSAARRSPRRRRRAGSRAGGRSRCPIPRARCRARRRTSAATPASAHTVPSPPHATTPRPRANASRASVTQVVGVGRQLDLEVEAGVGERVGDAGERGPRPTAARRGVDHRGPGLGRRRIGGSVVVRFGRRGEGIGCAGDRARPPPDPRCIVCATVVAERQRRARWARRRCSTSSRARSRSGCGG